QLLQEYPGSNTHLASQAAGYGVGQGFDVGIVCLGLDALRYLATGGIEVAHLAPYFHQQGNAEPLQPDLNCPRVVESGISGKIYRQALGQGRQPLYPHGAVEEGRCAGNQQEQSGETATIDFVHQLTQGIQADRKSTRLNSSHVKISYA